MANGAGDGSSRAQPPDRDDASGPASANSRTSRIGAWQRHAAMRLTAAAYAHGLALALPQAVMARPTGFERGNAPSGFMPIPIESAGGSRSAARESAWDSGKGTPAAIS